MNLKEIMKYTHVVVGFSGGKDSIAGVSHLLDLGVPQDRIQLWHHCIDGVSDDFMDWPVTEDYCRCYAAAMGLRIRFSWRRGGFRQEMLRHNTPTGIVCVEDGDNIVECGLGNGPPGLREKFPQVTANLSTRYCSAALKVDVCAAAIRNIYKKDTSVLLLTGERAEEDNTFKKLAKEIGFKEALASGNLKGRAKYKVFEKDRADARGPRCRRVVDHWRPVHGWPEEQVWDALRRYRINPHPAYRLGWGRLSCCTCIFGSPGQWASARAIRPSIIEEIAAYERQFGCTIDRRRGVHEKADKGKVYEQIGLDPELVKIALSRTYEDTVLVHGDWTYPAGAFGDSTGPT